MYFYPVNKFLYIEREKEEKKEQNFFYVEEKKSSGIEVVKLIRASENSSYVQYEGEKLIVSSIHIEEIDYNGQKILVAPESAVYGKILLA